MDTIWLTLFLPVMGALICGTLGRRMSKTLVGLVGTGAVVSAFGIAFLRLRDMLSLAVPMTTEAPLWHWLDIPLPHGKSVPIAFTALVDPLSITMLCIITGVGSLIHWYSTEYMAEEEDFSRFFAYLNTFVAAMTLLVLANNLAVLLIGWAGVGFASWALIGFYHHKPSAVAAARKAFLVNVIGDIGLMVAIFVAAWDLGSVDYSALEVPANYLKGAPFPEHLHIFVVGLLVAAYAKSAQLPMHTWLPDAMEGPTPVSALIHAATMVTAGVYLVVRCQMVFLHVPDLSAMVAGLGALTALFAGVCALFQTDLKRVLAYSTMSQLGYMFLAAGVGAYWVAIFHLVTHAFFKALLFLAAGIVIHGVHGEQDMREMGGLLKELPVAAVFFGVGGLALAGFPLTAGFFSKEHILISVQHAGGDFAGAWFLISALTAVLTAFYTGRAFFMTFMGGEKSYEHIHQPAASTILSCAFLVVLSLLAGYLAHPFAVFLLQKPDLEELAHAGMILHGVTAAALAAIGLAYYLYGSARRSDALSSEAGLAPYIRGGFGFDTVFLRAAQFLIDVSEQAYHALEQIFRGWLPGILGDVVTASGKALAEMQNGQLRQYTLMVTAAAALLALYILLSGGGL